MQTTDNLVDTNSWTVVPNSPAIFDLQNTVTNDITPGMRFYRLRRD